MESWSGHGVRGWLPPDGGVLFVCVCVLVLQGGQRARFKGEQFPSRTEEQRPLDTPLPPPQPPPAISPPHNIDFVPGLQYLPLCLN